MNTIHIPLLTRVEGEGALELEIHRKKIKKLQLRIYEPPRFFEKFLENRDYQEILDFVARICGICPVAYQMSATHAIENAFQTSVNPWIHDMRRVFYCGEWIESHSMHIHLLAIPDYFGFSSATEMAKQFPEEIRRGLRLQALGNALITLFGARSVHPVGACVGGFYHAPSLKMVMSLKDQLQRGLEDAAMLMQWLTTLSFSNYEKKFLCVSLHHPKEYAMTQGNIVSNQGLHISADEFENYFIESQVPHSNALHCLFNKQNYLVGPLARVNLNFAQLPETTQALVQQNNLTFPSYNMFHSILARAVEIHYAITEANRILEAYQPTENFSVSLTPREGTGFGATEAPRGLLWHRYEFNPDGKVKNARIIPPTSQNQARIENDLHDALIEFGLDRPDHELRQYCEMLIRNYDPCISCSTHFLDLSVKRT